MASAYDQAVATLYQTGHGSFVEERKRLSAELKGAGDKAAAARVAKLGRPTISAWAVNQLWWRARDAFDELFDTAAQLRAGKLSASSPHRKAIAKLSAEAQTLLKQSGHGVTDATLRRITMTLSGLAASGGFEPEAPGALTKDRDPPGFEAFGIASFGGEAPDAAPAEEQKRHVPAKNATHGAAKQALRGAEHKEKQAAAERARQAAETERAQIAELRTQRQAKRRELGGELRDAKAALSEREHERSRLAKELKSAEQLVERAAAALAKAEERLAGVESEP